MNRSATCRAALVSAPASGQGKTTVTAALARLFADRGDRVTVFKTGPDFLDPMVLARAARSAVHQLDLFMGGEAHCRGLLHDAARRSDVILIEGVMGLFDGAPSSADLAALFGIPVLAVVDASAMAGTFGAIVHGLATYRSDLAVVGAIANRVGGERHAAMLRDASPAGAPLLGCLHRSAEIALPERHLGLVQAHEVDSIDDKIATAATALASTFHAELPYVSFERGAEEAEPERWLDGCRIAVARDSAFSFLYTANLTLLEQMGATLRFFSPLADEAFPECDALYLPGGYPELHLARLEANAPMKRAVRAHHAADRPIVAECGGLLYLLERLTSKEGQSGEMIGLLRGSARMQPRLAALALQTVALPEGELRGHTFHHSLAEIDEQPVAAGVCPNGSPTAERVYRRGKLTASYVHFYFPSDPRAAAWLFRS